MRSLAIALSSAALLWVAVGNAGGADRKTGSAGSASVPPGLRSEFQTDFSRLSIAWSEVLSGGPSKDGIPAIDHPKLQSVTEADRWLEDKEPVVRVRVGADVRAYPIQILMWHELVNDVVGKQPLLISFCPLCNTAIVFERRLGAKVLDFGTTGRLRHSNLIMYDRQTESWWQQATGEAIVGEHLGAQLRFQPGELVAWKDFREAHPDGRVLSRDTGHVRDYGRNPYLGYDDVENHPFLYRGPPTPRALLPMARVLTVQGEGTAVAYPYEGLRDARVVNDRVADTELVILWAPGTASALDKASISNGRDVGTANAYSRRVDGRTLEFLWRDGAIVDRDTGTRWDARGRALEGPLFGTSLEAVVAVPHFWFSWAVWQPDTRIWAPP
jgi:hypothetical protein